MRGLERAFSLVFDGTCMFSCSPLVTNDVNSRYPILFESEQLPVSKTSSPVKAAVMSPVFRGSEAIDFLL